MHKGRVVTVEVDADGAGLVSRAGTALLGQVADKTGLTAGLLPLVLALRATKSKSAREQVLSAVARSTLLRSG